MFLEAGSTWSSEELRKLQLRLIEVSLAHESISLRLFNIPFTFGSSLRHHSGPHSVHPL